jgi:uncharacterized protein YdhG (YjbR/CyaY superfamily)
MNEAIFNYYLSKDEPLQSCLLALQSIVLRQDRNVTESIKWGLPCFSFNNKMFCFLAIDKKTNEPYILFVEGNYLNYPELEKGNRKRMKILRINPNSDLPIELLNLILSSALNFYRK